MKTPTIVDLTKTMWLNAAMNLKTYLDSLDAAEQARFAASCRTCVGHLRNVISGSRHSSAKLAVLIERNSGGAVTRRDLRDDWRDIWPADLPSLWGQS